MAKYMHISEYKLKEHTLELSCECGWNGNDQEAYREMHEAVLDFECPNCEKKLLIVNLIVDMDKFKDWKLGNIETSTPLSNNDKIVLYEVELVDIKIYMTMYFNDEDQLIFDGQDIGKRVEDIWGDSDYEYSYTIEPVEVSKLFPLFHITNFDRNALLLKIKERFEGNDAYSKFGDFMTENNIKYESFTWS